MALKVFASIASLAFSAFAIHLSSANLTRFKMPMESAKSPLFSSIGTERLDLITLGHRRVYDDYVFLWLLQHMEKPAVVRDPNQARRMFRLIDQVVSLEPSIESVYLYSCFVLAFDYQRPQLCESISVTGLKVFPGSWRIAMTQGYVSAFLLGERAKASVFYQLAATRRRSPPYVRSFAEKLMAEEHTEKDRKASVELLLSMPGLEHLRERLIRKFRATTSTSTIINGELPHEH